MTAEVTSAPIVKKNPPSWWRGLDPAKSIEISFITTKTVNKEWWWELNPVKMKAIEDYIKAFDGCVSYVSEMQDTNTRIIKIVFDQRWKLTRFIDVFYSECTEARERREYNDANEFVTITTYTNV